MKKDKQHEQFIKELKQFGKEILSDPELAKEQLYKAGINTMNKTYAFFRIYE